MSKKHDLIHLIIIAICYGSIVLFTACNNENEQEEWIRPEALTTIDSLIKENILLKDYTKDEDQYILTFENNQTLELHASQIISIHTNSDNWTTKIILTNNQEYNIPTLGNSINRFIKEIKVNPSGFCPLAASIRMELPSKGSFIVKVFAKEGAKTPDLKHQYAFSDDYTQDVIILGLYENYTNRVELTYCDKNGNERGKTSIEIPVAALNIKRLPKHNLLVSNPDAIEPGMTLVACPGEHTTDTSIPYMVDADGEVRWVIDWDNSEKLAHIGAQCGLSRMKNGNFIVGNTTTNKLTETDMLGNIVQEWDLEAIGYGFHHEVIESSNGNFLITAHKRGALCSDGVTTRVNDYIVEMNSKSGTVTQSWDLAQMLDSSRYVPTDPTLPGASTGQTQGNWAHNNAIVQTGSDYLASARFQGIFKYNAKGELLWIISPHKNWGPEFQKYLLTPIDEDGQPITDTNIINGDKSGEKFDWSWGVHNPILMPNGHILAYDNGYGRNFILRPFSDRSQYSRIVEYEVDEVKRTVRQIWQYGKDRHECYAPAYSGVQYLQQTGNYLFCPGMQSVLSDNSYGARIIEINPKTKEVVYELEIKGQLFRGTRMPLYPEK